MTATGPRVCFQQIPTRTGLCLCSWSLMPLWRLRRPMRRILKFGRWLQSCLVASRARGPRERLRTTYKDDRIKDLEALAADADDGLAVGARIVIAAGGIEVLAKARAAPDSTTSVLVNSAIALRRLLCGAQALGTDQERAQRRARIVCIGSWCGANKKSRRSRCRCRC